MATTVMTTQSAQDDQMMKVLEKRGKEDWRLVHMFSCYLPVEAQRAYGKLCLLIEHVTKLTAQRSFMQRCLAGDIVPRGLRPRPEPAHGLRVPDPRSWKAVLHSTSVALMQSLVRSLGRRADELRAAADGAYAELHRCIRAASAGDAAIAAGRDGGGAADPLPPLPLRVPSSLQQGRQSSPSPPPLAIDNNAPATTVQPPADAAGIASALCDEAARRAEDLTNFYCLQLEQIQSEYSHDQLEPQSYD